MTTNQNAEYADSGRKSKSGGLVTQDEMKEFEALTRPLIKWLNDNCHPHVTVIVTPTSGELLEGLTAFPTNDYLKD